jgi:hypothetical protein
LSAEEEYVRRHVKERPTVESFYYQKNVDDVKEALENFWKERGIAVEVTESLMQATDASRYVALEFRVYRKYSVPQTKNWNNGSHAFAVTNGSD